MISKWPQLRRTGDHRQSTLDMSVSPETSQPPEDRDRREAKKLLCYVAIMVAVGILFSCATNYVLDDFGLWGRRKTVRVWGMEKTTKYLLAHKHVPDNFRHVIAGPSLSANLNPDDFECDSIYNLSMSGANATEVSRVASKAIETGRIQTLVICLDPYLTKDAGLKGNQISDREYYGSLYSAIPLKLMLHRANRWWTPDDDEFHSSEKGWNDMHLHKDHIDPEKWLNSSNCKQYRSMPLVDEAVDDLRGLTKTARANHVRIIAWYYPSYYRVHESRQASGEWDTFAQTMSEIFNEDELFDFNEMTDFTSNPANYSDGHLSRIGATTISRRLGALLKAGEPGNTSWNHIRLISTSRSRARPESL